MLARLGSLTVLASFIGLCVGACTTTQPPQKTVTVTPDPVTSTQPLVVVDASVVDASAPVAVVDASTDLGWNKEDWPKSWRDPRVVHELFANCEFDPPPRPGGGGGFTPSDPLHCTFGYSQACAPDVCNLVIDECKDQCKSTCIDCGKACTDKCKACKASCVGAECTQHCAETCGSCKADCDTHRDECAAGDCMKAVGVCHKRLKASFQAHGCAAKCAQYRSCTNACNKPNAPDTCWDKCQEALSPGFAKCADSCLRDGGEPDAKCMIDCYVNVPCGHTLCDLGVH